MYVFITPRNKHPRRVHFLGVDSELKTKNDDFRASFHRHFAQAYIFKALTLVVLVSGIIIFFSIHARVRNGMEYKIQCYF